MTKTHWLYGIGPDKIVEFHIELDIETDCTKCCHRVVCPINVIVICSNYEFGTSAEKACQSCSHKFTRWDHKVEFPGIPCFHCKHFMEIESVEESKPEPLLQPTVKFPPAPIEIYPGNPNLLWVDEDKLLYLQKAYTNYSDIVEDYPEDHPFRLGAKVVFVNSTNITILVVGSKQPTKEDECASDD